MTFDIEIDREVDGRWIAEVSDLAGVMTYGATREEAVAHVQALALRVIADRLEHNGACGSFDRHLPRRVSVWPAKKARLVLAALEKIGWRVKRRTGSHRTLSRDGRPDIVFAC